MIKWDTHGGGFKERRNGVGGERGKRVTGGKQGKGRNAKGGRGEIRGKMGRER